ncbi:hypothetical protein CC86DRAFT_382630 [Ophiobolus disseminans]|uniref:Uncharacterized protein n=1 Tax=Ophiobolus disseminans TaxID=1469910 RepID=A0A6A6ZX18_9PLEO|nr:hypothetical protein CC86DRAFT_382630 [Ophiobolus disseminans]
MPADGIFQRRATRLTRSLCAPIDTEIGSQSQNGLQTRSQELWALLPYYDGNSTWTACHGIHCAKLLGRLGAGVFSGAGYPWSLQNKLTRQAENWALYALARYVQTTVRDQAYPWLPLLDGQLETMGIPRLLSTLANNGISGIYATAAFSSNATYSQLRYNQSRYQIALNEGARFLNNTTGGGIDQNRLFDLRTASLTPYRAYYANFTASLDKFIADYEKAVSNGILSFGLGGGHSCFKRDDHPTFQGYGVKEAVQSSREFCNKLLKPMTESFNNSDWQERLISPLLQQGTKGRKSALLYSLPQASSNRSITFGIAADFGAVIYRFYSNFFDGTTFDVFVKGCERVFTNLIIDVSLETMANAFLGDC